MKKFISSILVLALLVSCVVLAGCEKQSADDYVDPTKALKVNVSDDKYRNFYHIWVCSFNDADADETGDLQGIIDKLDYINDGDPETDTDLGMDGIWLSPMMPSDSYHKYDVDDYMEVDPEFGDLETFDKLIEECNKRGIRVILDLVLNHCGTGHEFWKNAVEEAREGKLDGYAKYFHLDKGKGGTKGWHYISGTDGIWYEGQFSPEMPEWNLEYQGTRDYFEEVAKFWLDRGVAGFRLDAVMYMTDDQTDGTEFLNWFYTTAQKYNPEVYMVGENWQGNSEIYRTYESGIDSQFAFSFATAGGQFSTSVNSGNGKTLAAQLKKFDDNSHKANENVISAMFLSNHDMVRCANYFAQNLPYQKMGAAAYLLTPGNSFTYYGEEIGMAVPEGYNDNDAFFRGAMNWDETVETTIWCTADAYQDCPYGGVAQQTDDEDSLLSFYRRAVKIKNQNPEIARGRITATYPMADTSICAFKVEYEGKSLLVIHNMNCDDSAKIEITEDMMANPVIRGDLYAQTSQQRATATASADAKSEGLEQVKYASITEGVLTMPAQSSVVIGSAQ